MKRILVASGLAAVRIVQGLGIAVDEGLEPLAAEFARRQRQQQRRARFASSVERTIERLP